MKLISFATVALLCITVVSTDSMEDELDKRLQDSVCEVKVMEKVANNTNYQMACMKMVLRVTELAIIDRLDCHKPNVENPFRCLSYLHHEVTQEISAFEMKVMIGDTKLLEKIWREVGAQCHGGPKLFMDVDRMVGNFQCFAEVMDKVSMNNDLWQMWAGFEMELKHHIDSWKQCASDASCNAKEMDASQHALNEYITKLLMLNHSKAVDEYANGIRSMCGAGELVSDLEMMFDKVSNTSKCYHCFSDVMGEAWKHYGMTEMWSYYEPQLQFLFEDWKVCDTAGNPHATRFCNNMKAGATYGVLNQCRAMMNSMNPEIANEFVVRAKEKCEQICHK